ncbi:unnamed protein product [Hydatigera taeniaeformis]|uniref:Non-specific serine/threonine protein kinase n=1 Tax=Hydatigena taeniaeformis TaxID=6205 RepID=A0A158RF47_HYDTA|nr:unnamed protein product [Hydatigera taeniaeformis]
MRETTTDSTNLSPFDQLATPYSLVKILPSSLLVASPVKVLPVHAHLLMYLHRYDFNQVSFPCVSPSQVIYALSRLYAVLKSDVGALFVLALAASPTASKGPSDSASGARELPRFASCDFPILFGTSERLTSHCFSIVMLSISGSLSECAVSTLLYRFFPEGLADLLARHYRCLMAGGCDDFAHHSTMDEIGRIVNVRMPSLLDVLLFICLTFLLSLSLPSEPAATSAANANVRLVAAELLQLVTEASYKCQKSRTGPNAILSPLLLLQKLLHLAAIFASSEAGKLTLDTQKDETGMTALVAILYDSGSSWIDAVIQRSGLSQAVLHCLATSTELTHIYDSLNTVDDASLPLCLRLLKYNDSTESLAELSCLLQITRHLLQLTAPRDLSLKKSPPLNAPSSNRSNKTPPTATKTASKKSTNQPSSAPPRVHFSGALPWCPSQIPILDSTLRSLTTLTPSPTLLAVLTSHFLGSDSSTTHPRSRHVATQVLLLNTLRLGLCPTARVDLHPLWFTFLRESLVYWGPATALLINLVASQMSVILQMLAEPFCYTMLPARVNGRTPSTSDYPADYTLQLLDCLRGITHTFLLPFGQSKFNLLHGMTLGATAFARNWSPPFTRHSPTHRRKHSCNLSSNFKTTFYLFLGTCPSFIGCETPEVLRDSIRVAEVLRAFHVQNQRNFDFGPLGPLLHRMQRASLGSESPSSALQIPFIFTSKDLLGTEVMPDSDDLAQCWARARAETCYVFPTILASLATVWLALNQSCNFAISLPSTSSGGDLKASFETGIDALCSSTTSQSGTDSAHLRCGFDRLPALTALGHPEVVRRAIDNFLEPIALTHPNLFFAALAYVWPPPGGANSGLGGSSDLMWLLSPSSTGLPLTPRQCALVSLVSGSFRGFQECGNRNGSYVTLSIDPGKPEQPVGLLRPGQAVKTLRNLLRSPPASLALAFALDLAHSEALTSLSVEGTLPPQIMQSSLLHFLYVWIVTTGGIGCGSFQSANIQDFLRDVAPLTSISAAISTTSSLGTAITSPIAVFVLVKIFNEVITTLSNKDEKRDQKDLQNQAILIPSQGFLVSSQDVCQRLMETTASIAGTALEQATWFRRGLQVRSTITTATSTSAADVPGSLRPSDFMHSVASESSLVEIRSNGNAPFNMPHGSQELLSSGNRDSTSNSVYVKEDLSVLALKILAEVRLSPTLHSYSLQLVLFQSSVFLLSWVQHMAVFFDVVYKSDEKDRVPSALNNGILTNILPFLKSHNIANACHYTAASQVLASLSSYQFTRRAWRREVFELFIDSTFFQASALALHSWRAVVDNLMTQEKNTFKEALTRLTVSQGTGLNIFSSKEAEYEQRAAHLKKVNFIVFSSEREQYSRSVSEILERLTDNLRAITDVNVPILTQIFLCARVLIARISADSLASLWFIVIPELVRVFRIFAERCNGGSKKHPALSFNDLQKLPQAQLTLLLSACKLLATILLLPESAIPQLLFHRWVFVCRRIDEGSATEVEEEGSQSNGTFQPLMSQISCGLTSIYQNENQIYTTQLLSMTNAYYFILSTKSVTTFEPLELFFRSLGEKRAVPTTSGEVIDEGAWFTNQVLEVSLFNEFPESMAASK